MLARAQELRVRRLRKRLLERLVVRPPRLPEQGEDEGDRVERVVDPVQVRSDETEPAPRDPTFAEDPRRACRRTFERVVEEEEVVLGLVCELERGREPQPWVARELRQQ